MSTLNFSKEWNRVFKLTWEEDSMIHNSEATQKPMSKPTSIAANDQFSFQCFNYFITGDDPVWNKMYVGCWEDKNTASIFNPTDYNSRDFDIYIIDNSIAWNGITLDRCVPACVTLGYRYAALQVRYIKK